MRPRTFNAKSAIAYRMKRLFQLTKSRKKSARRRTKCVEVGITFSWVDPDKGRNVEEFGEKTLDKALEHAKTLLQDKEQQITVNSLS